MKLRELPFLLGGRSLALRVVAFSSVWAIIALIVISTVIGSLYREASERGFDSVLSAHLFNLIGSVGATPSGQLSGGPDLGDLRFLQPNSGWYWSVEPVTPSLTGTLHSPSMTASVASPSIAEVPFDSSFQRSYLVDGIAGEELEVIEAEFVLGGENRVARFRVMGNRSDLQAEISGFNRRLFTYLGLFGLGMVAINVGAILLGLRPLRQVGEALAQVQEGNALRLDGPFPSEIAPLAEETNALIDNNRRIVERSRTQVGNLAHSLKTPIAVLVNEGRALGGEKGRLIAGQAEAMQHQVEHYLKRARMAAQRESVVFRAPVGAVVRRLARVMEKLGGDKALSLRLPEAEIVFAGEREDLEEIVGNLLENAMKWASGKVILSVERVAEDNAAGRDFTITIEDDGPGIPEERAREVLERGRRLDETKPGSGLGLAIVTELVKEYGGEVALGRSGLGGLRATVRLRGTQ